LEASIDGSTNYASDLDLALELAGRADAITMDLFTSSRATVKADRSLVTEADLLVEDEAAKLLGRERPEDAIIAEEAHSDTIPKRRSWAIDPIDHTNNYARGLPVFGTLISLLENGRPVVGVVSAPVMGMRWWAAKGAGAWANGNLIHVSDVADLQDAHMSFSQLEEWDRLGLLQKISNLTRATRWEFGSGGFPAQMWLAEGKLDIALDSTGYVWDLAASQIIVEEAGGMFTDLVGEPSPWRGHAIVTNRVLHQAVMDFMNAP
jgi:histidinol-phosphatase